MAKQSSAPYVHTDKTNTAKGCEWLVALIPIIIWSVYMFGARVITLCLIGALLSLALDFAVRYFLYRQTLCKSIDIMTAVYGTLAVFSMPVTVPLWMPVLSSLFVVIAKNIRIFRAKLLFNPYIFATGLLYLCFNEKMTCFTRPFAYFSPFSFSIDQRLIDGYRVISPLQYMADGSVYEDGVFAQLYGYASGCIGEIAVAMMILSLIWLCLRKEADWKNVIYMLAPVLLLALVFPTDDAESSYYAYSVILSGALVFLAVFATNESNTVPITKLGKFVFALIGGVLIFTTRRLGGGFEWGYYIILLLNLASPFIEKFTRPIPLGSAKGKR